MGRIKSKKLRSIAYKIYAQNKDAFSEDFSANKETLGNVATIRSKKIRNVLAGYITGTLVKQE